MPKERSYALSIAGFDPSGGAGILADIKTFEQHKITGMGVVSGLTFQNDTEFDGVRWIESDEIVKQIEVLTRKFQFQFIKIGLLQNLKSMEAIATCLRAYHPVIKIIWDPILKASAGFEIHKSFEKEKLHSILKTIYLLTPNLNEIKNLTGEEDSMKAAKDLSKLCNIFLKGGHSRENQGRDYLLTTDGKFFSFKPRIISKAGKHGSGCVLSSAITANLSNGLSLHRSCMKGKDYVTKFLTSNKSLLGYHKM